MKGLVLSGGGAAGSWQTGVLKRLLYDEETYYDVVAGVSVGAINGAGVAQFFRGQEKEAYKFLEELWLSVSNKDVWKYRFPPYLAALWSNSIYKTHPLRQLISTHLDVQKVRDAGKKLIVEAVSLTTGKAHTWTEKSENLVEAIMASSAFPGFFESIEVGGEIYTDGGVRNVSPLSAAIKADATDIDLVLCVKGGMSEQRKKWKVADVLSRSFNIIFDEVVENDIKLCLERNNNPAYKQITLNIIRPSQGIQGDLDFNPEVAKQQIELGYKDAQTILLK